jgi:hypothetical protein
MQAQVVGSCLHKHVHVGHPSSAVATILCLSVFGRTRRPFGCDWPCGVVSRIVNSCCLETWTEMNVKTEQHVRIVREFRGGESGHKAVTMQPTQDGIVDLDYIFTSPPKRLICPCYRLHRPSHLRRQVCYTPGLHRLLAAESRSTIH